MIDRNRSITKETKLICLCEGNAYQQDWNPSLLLPEIDPEACVCARGWDWGGVQLLWLLDIWKLIAVEEHVLPLAFIWFLAMTLRKRGSII